VEAKIHSAIKPDFYRIYRIEQAVDVVRSVPARQFSQLFDGSEQLISITSLPWYSREVPDQRTQ
jgi:hypothetical protein